MKQRLMRISCRHAQELMSMRLDGRPSWIDRIRLSLHVRICIACARVERQFATMSAAFKRLGE